MAEPPRRFGITRETVYKFDGEDLKLRSPNGRQHALIWICCACHSISAWHAPSCSNDNISARASAVNPIPRCTHNWHAFAPARAEMLVCSSCWLLEVDPARYYTRAELVALGVAQARARAPWFGRVDAHAHTGAVGMHGGRPAVFANVTGAGGNVYLSAPREAGDCMTVANWDDVPAASAAGSAAGA